jgi:Fe-S-cluster containining protein
MAGDGSSVCRNCGACCAYSRDWPRFTLEHDTVLARIPPHYVDAQGGRMRCEGDRCSALEGDVGVETGCRIYDARPEVCRACEPGDDACGMAREHFGLPTIARAGLEAAER